MSGQQPPERHGIYHAGAHWAPDKPDDAWRVDTGHKFYVNGKEWTADDVARLIAARTTDLNDAANRDQALRSRINEMVADGDLPLKAANDLLWEMGMDRLPTKYECDVLLRVRVGFESDLPPAAAREALEQQCRFLVTFSSCDTAKIVASPGVFEVVVDEVLLPEEQQE